MRALHGIVVWLKNKTVKQKRTQKRAMRIIFNSRPNCIDNENFCHIDKLDTSEARRIALCKSFFKNDVLKLKESSCVHYLLPPPRVDACYSSRHHLTRTTRFIDSFHRLRGSARTVLTATSQVNGRWRILTPHRIETHEPTATKFHTIDYVRGRTP